MFSKITHLRHVLVGTGMFVVDSPSSRYIVVSLSFYILQ